MAARANGFFKISHFLHLRAEICSETLLEELAAFTPEDRVGIVSLMDHTPGQRQFRDLTALKTYVMKKRGMNDVEFAEHVANLRTLQARFGEKHQTGAVVEARRYGAVLASHDDTTADQVRASAANGVGFAEFPTTREAAAACRAHGIAVHIDAVQACGRVAVDFATLGVDLMSVSSHKLGGPMGIGALIMRDGFRLPSLLQGGAQERRRRAGTGGKPAPGDGVA